MDSFNFSLNPDGTYPEPGSEWNVKASTFANFFYPDDPGSAVSVNAVTRDAIHNGLYSINDFLTVTNGSFMEVKGFDPSGFALPEVLFGELNSNGTVHTINGTTNWPSSRHSNKLVPPQQYVYRSFLESTFPYGIVTPNELKQIQVYPNCSPSTSKCKFLSESNVWRGLVNNVIIDKYDQGVIGALFYKIPSCTITSQNTCTGYTNSTNFLVNSTNNSSLTFTPGQQQEIYTVLANQPYQGEISGFTSVPNQGDIIFNWLKNPNSNANCYPNFNLPGCNLPFLNNLITTNGIVVQGYPVNPQPDHSIIQGKFPDDYVSVGNILNAALAGRHSFMWNNRAADGVAKTTEFEFLDAEANGACGPGESHYRMGVYVNKPQLARDMSIWFTNDKFDCLNILTPQGRLPIFDNNGKKTGQYVPEYSYNNPNSNANSMNNNIYEPVSSFIMAGPFSKIPYQAVQWVNFDPNNDSLYIMGDGPKNLAQSCAGDRSVGRYLSRIDPPQGWKGNLESYMATNPTLPLTASWTIDLYNGVNCNSDGRAPNPGMVVRSAAQTRQRILIAWAKPVQVPEQGGETASSYELGEIYDTDGNIKEVLTTNPAEVGTANGWQDYADSSTLGFHPKSKPDENDEYLAMMENCNGDKAYAFRIH